MKKQLFIPLILCIAFKSYAQITFEEGYFITDNGEKKVCLIKNKDWRNNPETFEYKTEKDGPIKLADISYVKEFGIFNASKYERHLVKIDKSSSVLSHLSHEKRPEWEEKLLFLKVLIEGEGTLYMYENPGGRKFFFSVNDFAVEQLVFKKYKTSGNSVGKNDHFKQQLWTDLKCESLSLKDIKNLNYSEGDFIRYFTKFNNCKNSAITHYKENKNIQFNFKLVPGINISSFALLQPGSLYKTEKNIEFDKKIGFKPGVEAEFIMPFNKNKWSFFLQPSYQSFKSEERDITITGTTVDTVSVSYKAIEIPVGLRHHFFLSDDAKLFVNAAFVIDLVLDSKIDFKNRADRNINHNTTLAFGLGFNKNRYGIELRYALNRNITRNEEILDPWEFNYNLIAFNLTYTIFK